MGTNQWKKWLHVGLSGSLAAVLMFAAFPSASSAAETDGSFNIQVSPSPLVVTLKPNEIKSATITVRNLSNHVETLYPSLKGFDVDDNQNITIKDQLPANLEDWVSFQQSSLTIPAGAAQPLDITYATPADVGFSYGLAVFLSRKPTAPSPDSLRLEGAVAVFNLINIDRPGAISALNVQGISTKQGTYEFLPATFEITVKNTGNIIVQPSGTLFIQRSFDSDKPISTIDINQSEGYILPGKSRTFSLDWASGFPSYQTERAAGNTTPVKKLRWDWRHANELRLGRYHAKAVVVYSDGQRAVPLTTSVSFWVIPWRLIGGAVVVLALIIMGILASGWLGFKAAKKVRHKVRHHGNQS